MVFAIIDTGVYIDHLERGRVTGDLTVLGKQFVVRHSAVVLSELRRGARTKEAIRLVELMRRNATVIWEPTVDDWWRAGELVREIGDTQKWETNKRREFQNDALIALTAVRHGASVVTRNRNDFTLLANATGLRVVNLN